MTPTQSEARRRMYRRRRIAFGASMFVVLAMLVSGGYTVAVAAAPLPDLRPKLTVEAEMQFDADPAPAETAVAAHWQPTAVGWLHNDEVWSNDDTPYRIASIAKLVTTLVGFEAAPFSGDGPVYTVGVVDQRALDEVIALNGSFAPAPFGLELTTRQLFDLMLVPSANNYAIAYASWVFGSEEAYVAAANEWLQQRGLASMHVADATGLSDDNVGSAADIVRLSRLVLAHPILSEVVAQSTITIPELGLITTTNRLLGEPGVIGVKTGTAYGGYNLAAAQREHESGRDLVTIAVVLERDDAEARANDARLALSAVHGAWQPLMLVESGEQVGTVTTWEGDEVPLVTAGNADTTLVPGESATRTIRLDDVDAGPSGQRVGGVTVTAPTGGHDIAVVTSAEINAPDLWWRLTNPGPLFGW